MPDCPVFTRAKNKLPSWDKYLMAPSQREYRQNARDWRSNSRNSDRFWRFFWWYNKVINSLAVYPNRAECHYAWFGSLQKCSRNFCFLAARKGSTEQNHISFIILKTETGFCGIFKKENKFVYYDNISDLLQDLEISLYNPNDWRLILDNSKRRLMCVLLHNSNVYAAVPVGHSTCLREEHNGIKTVMDLLKYHEHN